MKTFFPIVLFISLMLGSLSSHGQVQLSGSLAGGRSYTQIDEASAVGSSFKEHTGFAGQLGLELAALMSDRWRVSLGVGATYQELGLEIQGVPWAGFWVDQRILALHIPLEVQHRIPTGSGKYLVLRAGGSLITSPVGQKEGSGGFSVREVGGGQDGAIFVYNTHHGQPLGGNLRLGLGQEWVLGKGKSSMQLSLLYVQGLSTLYEGQLRYWDMPPSNNRSFLLQQAIADESFGEPTETYPLFFSRGSMLCIELKYFFSLKSKKVNSLGN